MNNSLPHLATAAAFALLPLLITPAGAQTLAPNANINACAVPNAQARTIVAQVPEIPSALQSAGLTSGTTMVQVDIDGEGRVVNAAVLKTSGVYGLDQAALRAAKESTFQPQITNCVGVAGSYIFEVDFPG